jgi:hypothetical protein
MSEQNSENIIQTPPESQAAKRARLVQKCFEYYYRLGVNRSLLEVEKTSKVPLDTLQEWHDGYGWEEKITHRNKELDRVIEENYKLKSRDIRNRLIAQMNGLLDAVEGCSLGLPFNVTSVADLKQLAQAYETLVRANILANTKAQDLLGSGSSPKTWADLLNVDDGDRPDTHTVELD